MSSEPIQVKRATHNAAEQSSEPHDKSEGAPASVKAQSLSGLKGEELERALGAVKNGVTQSNISHTSPTQQRRNPNTWSARELIKLAKAQPPQSIIRGLLNVGDILLLHGTEESFKSVMVVQCAESIAMGIPFLRTWQVPKARRVGIIETEMHETMMGERLTKMFPDGNAPGNMYFMSESLLHQWRREDLSGKFRIIQDWIDEEDIQVLMIDTANDFFRGVENPSEERSVGEFFDKLRSLRVEGRIIVRHDRKKKDIDSSSHSNEMIRGSAEWKEDPEAIVHLNRIDRRTHELQMEVGKLRYGVKPAPIQLWFDSEWFRLIPLPPVIAVLECGLKTREEVVSECERFGLEERATDAQLRTLQPFLKQGMAGHRRTYELDRTTCQKADWASALNPAAAARVEDMQTSLPKAMGTNLEAATVEEKIA